VYCIKGVTTTVDIPDSGTLREGFTSYGVRFYEVVTPTVLRVVHNFFNCPIVTGARLENQPTSGDCFGDHWEERLSLAEL
jgi:hypothetical protein